MLLVLDGRARTLFDVRGKTLSVNLPGDPRKIPWWWPALQRYQAVLMGHQERAAHDPGEMGIPYDYRLFLATPEAEAWVKGWYEERKILGKSKFSD